MARVDVFDDDYEVEDVENGVESTDEENLEVEGSDATSDDSSAEDAAPAESAEATAEATAEAPTGPTDEEVKALVEAFTTTVEEVVTDTEGRDQSTGHLAGFLVQRVKGKFSELPAGKARKAAKDYLQDKMKTCMDNALSSGDMDANLFAQARSYLQLHEEATSVAKTAAATVARPQLSPTEQLLQRALPIYLAPMTLEVPAEGIDADWQEQLTAKASELSEQVQTYYGYLAELAKLPEDAENKPEEPAVDDAVKQAFRLSRGRSVGATKRAAGTKGAGTPRQPGAARGNVGRHIINAFEGKASGTFLTVAEIVNTESADAGYSKGDKPSPGAVAARLFKDGQPHTTLAGIVPGFEVDGDASTKKGARKA